MALISVISIGLLPVIDQLKYKQFQVEIHILDHTADGFSVLAVNIGEQTVALAKAELNIRAAGSSAPTLSSDLTVTSGSRTVGPGEVNDFTIAAVGNEASKLSYLLHHFSWNDNYRQGEEACSSEQTMTITFIGDDGDTHELDIIIPEADFQNLLEKYFPSFAIPDPRNTFSC